MSRIPVTWVLGIASSLVIFFRSYYSSIDQNIGALDSIPTCPIPLLPKPALTERHKLACIRNITVCGTEREGATRTSEPPCLPVNIIYTRHTQTAKTCVRGINSLGTVSWTIKSLKTGFGQTQKTAALFSHMTAIRMPPTTDIAPRT